MTRKSELMQLADMQYKRDMIALAVDVLRNPVVAMVAGVSLVNAIYKYGPDKDDDKLYSNEIRGLMQAAAIGFPLVAGAGGSGGSALTGASSFLGGTAIGAGAVALATKAKTAAQVTAAAAKKTAAAAAKVIPPAAGAVVRAAPTGLLPMFIPKKVIQEVMGPYMGQPLDS